MRENCKIAKRTSNREGKSLNDHSIVTSLNTAAPHFATDPRVYR